MKISLTLLSGHNLHTENFKGTKFRKHVRRVMVLSLSFSSDNDLYL